MTGNSLKETIRKDGLRIITKRLSGTKKSRLAVIVKFGTAYEYEGQAGLAHFLEHALFCGTSTYSKQDIKQLMDYYCGDNNWNAYTSLLSTEFWGETVSRFENLCGLLLDIYANAVFPASKIEPERQTVLAEIALNSDDNTEKSYEALWKMLWQKNPSRRLVLGTPESVSLITRKLLLHIHQRWYKPYNTVILGLGRVEHDFLVEKIKRLIPLDMPEEKNACRIWDKETDVLPLKKEQIFLRRDCECATVNVGCKIPVLCRRQEFAFFILNAMIDFGLETLVRDKLGLSYSINSSFSGHDSLGYVFSFAADCLPDKAAEVKELIYKIVCESFFGEEIFKMQKEIISNAWLAGAESTAHWQHCLSRLLIESSNDVSLDFIRKYFAVRRRVLAEISYKEVVELREAFLKRERLACVIITPLK